uniref:Mannosyltransferase n=1 Tax=Gongylonema pulchrum TaxID=637853 RepID=A0A183CWM5_9BILA
LAYAVVAHLVFNICGTCIFTTASQNNYPGAEALNRIQRTASQDRLKPVLVHIDGYAAQTGISRFLEDFDAWEYNKTENLDISDLIRFDYLMIGSYMQDHVREIAMRNFSSTHQLSFTVFSFKLIRDLDPPL